MWPDTLKILSGLIAGAALCVVLAKYLITKSLEDLKSAVILVNEINLKLAVVASKVERIDSLADIVLEHDRKIIALEQRRVTRN